MSDWLNNSIHLPVGRLEFNTALFSILRKSETCRFVQTCTEVCELCCCTGDVPHLWVSFDIRLSSEWVNVKMCIDWSVCSSAEKMRVRALLILILTSVLIAHAQGMSVVILPSVLFIVLSLYWVLWWSVIQCICLLRYLLLWCTFYHRKSLSYYILFKYLFHS